MGRVWYGLILGSGCLAQVTGAMAQPTDRDAETTVAEQQSASGAEALATGDGPVVAVEPLEDSAEPSESPPETLPDPLRAKPPASTPTDPRRAACLLGDHAGIPEADARTAASIVCGELATHGPKPGRTYRVGLGKLGKVIVLSLAEELEDGTVTAHRQVNLSNIEEVLVAAPRLVAALREDKPIEETETVENLVGQDTRQLRKREGVSFFGLGVVGLLADAEGINTSVGADMAFGYEAPAMAIGYDLRFVAISQGVGVGMFATGPFARYFLVKTDISPFVGGGLGPMLLRIESEDLHAERWGLAFWAEAGVEMMRTHKSQLVVGGRLDIPTFSVSDDNSSGFALPFEIVAAFSFD